MFPGLLLNTFGFALGIATAMNASAQDITLAVAEDAYTHVEKSTTRFGSKQLLVISPGLRKIALFKFDMVGTATVDSAELNVPIEWLRNDGDLTINRVEGGWNEATISHDKLPRLTPVGTVRVVADGRLRIDMTALVQQWIADSSANHGVAITSDGGAHVRLLARESGVGAELVVTGSNSRETVPDADVSPDPGPNEQTPPEENPGSGATPDAMNEPRAPSNPSATLRVAHDTYTRADQPTTRFGDKRLVVISAGSTKIGLLQFDLAGVSTVSSAHLRIPVEYLRRSGGLTISRVQQPWSEDSVTHNLLPGFVPVDTVSADNEGPLLVDVTDLVRDWAANPATNHGFALSSEGSTYLRIFAKESGKGAELVLGGVDGGGDTSATPAPSPDTPGSASPPPDTSSGVPDARPDQARTDQGRAVTIDVLANDANLTDSPIRVKVIGAPQHGTAEVLLDNRIRYTPNKPNASYLGSDSFIYQVRDGSGDVATASVQLNVDCPSTACNRTFQLRWTGVNDDRVTEYCLYHGTRGGPPYPDQTCVGKGVSSLDWTLSVKTGTDYFAATSKWGDGTESVFSNELKVVSFPP